MQYMFQYIQSYSHIVLCEQQSKKSKKFPNRSNAYSEPLNILSLIAITLLAKGSTCKLLGDTLALFASRTILTTTAGE